MKSLAPYAGSPTRVIHKMLDLAEPQYGELLLDIGSGKGNVIIESAKKYPDIKCVGIELDSALVNTSRNRIHDYGLDGRVEIVKGNFLDYRLDDANIVTAYLTTQGMKAIEDKIFSELSVDARLVSHDYGFAKHSPNKLRPVIAMSAFTPWLPFPVLHYAEIYWMNNVKMRKSIFT